MWHKLWPDRAQSEVPIGHITNGAHVDTWVANELGQLFRDVLGTDWQTHLSLPERWRRIEHVDPPELWSLKLALKRRLFQFLGRRHQARADREGLQTPLPRLRTARLTIGFARRFALYKRALLLFRDRERALRLLTDPERPIQLIFAGKAHPADAPGQDVLQQLHELSTEPELRDHLIILEKHDMNVSRHLLEGCDLWLNAPRRPLEACGTSGMKAVFNCALNCSILDGWWDEAYDGRNGFAFGGGRVHVDPAVQDQRDADDLLRVLEDEVVPTYYDRDDHGVPRRWIDMIIHALSTLAWRYNSDRMVMDYARNAYLPTARKATSVPL
jgi:starch phosphorylase